MSPVVDETAGDLPVRDVGLMRGGLMPTLPDTVRDTKPLRKHHYTKTKVDPQRVFRFPREHLEDLCLRLQEENSVLKQHTRTQEQRIRRMSTRLMRVRQARPGSSGVRDRDLEDTIQELEARVAMLESQKELLHHRLNLAKQNILELGGATPYKLSKGKSFDGEGGARRATHTAPPRYGPALDETRDTDRLRSSVNEQLRITQLELTAQTLRDTLRDREREYEGTVRDMKRTQAERHRSTIRENVDLIRLQKELSDKSTALRVTEEKYSNLKEAFEKQAEESQRSLKESQTSLLLRVEELSEQLKEERQKGLELEGQLSSASLSEHTMDKLQERISDLEGERDLIKGNYDTLLEGTLSAQSTHGEQVHRDVSNKSEDTSSAEVHRLKEVLQMERERRGQLEEENQRLRQERQQLQERERSENLYEPLEEREKYTRETSEKQKLLEQEVVQYKEQVSNLQNKLNSISKGYDMSVEELSDTLFQIKAFRLRQESREGLQFLRAEGKVEESSPDITHVQASHAETVLELQKTRQLLLTEHHISKDLQEELKIINQKMEREREESRRRMTEKDKLLSKRTLQINTLQAQLKELAYSPRNYKRTIPIQYTWPTGDQEAVQLIEDDLTFAQLKAGESLLEIHLKCATFTPSGLRALGSLCPLVEGGRDMVSFCTYSLLDFEVHSTPLVSGTQPNYGFTSRYALTPRDLERLRGQGSGVRVELHQALGGVQFVTHGGGVMSLMGAMERRGERDDGRVNITGSEGGTVAVVDFWARLYPPAEPIDSGTERAPARATHRVPAQITLGWQDTTQEELHDYGGGIPNELVVTLERCVGLSARWPGLLPDAYLNYRLYDLPPHASHTVQCSIDPVFNDSTCYPLAVTSDLLNYFRCSSLWVYVFDDSDDQMPPAYLAKTPVPLRALAVGREIRGDYVLRDPAGGPRGMVRVMMKWKYPFKPPTDAESQRRPEEGEKERRKRGESQTSEKPIAKPRVKTKQDEADVGTEQRQTQPRPPLKQKSSQQLFVPVKPSRERKSSSRRSTESEASQPQEAAPCRKRSEETSVSRSSSVSGARTQDLQSVDQVFESEHKGHTETDEEEESSEASQTSSSYSDIVIIPPHHRVRSGEKLRVEILSLSLEPSSSVVVDKSVQRLFVEYRLLGVPLESTETPMSLRKPSSGQEIHFNFTRVIYVDGSHSAPLRHYLFTMLEGTDPNQGRLKFTVVSEPLDEEEECVDVGHAFVDLKELLLKGHDVMEQQINIVSVDEEKEVIGHLKVSLEAATVLSGIYREFQQQGHTEKQEEEPEDEEKEPTRKELQVIEYDEESDF